MIVPRPKFLTSLLARITVIFLTIGAPALLTAAVEHELQQGLTYLRTEEPALDLAIIEKNLATHPALVLDLRASTADEETASSLRRLLARPPATPRFARFILLSESTAKPLLNALRADLPGVVTLAALQSSFTPDIMVATTSEEDAHALDALGRGLSFEKLLSGTTPQKIRYDEASLVRDHAIGNGGSRTFPSEEITEEPAPDEEPGNTTAEKIPPQPVDRVLLRAVQLHRTLLALKKL